MRAAAIFVLMGIAATASAQTRAESGELQQVAPAASAATPDPQAVAPQVAVHQPVRCAWQVRANGADPGVQDRWDFQCSDEEEYSLDAHQQMRAIYKQLVSAVPVLPYEQRLESALAVAAQAPRMSTVLATRAILHDYTVFTFRFGYVRAFMERAGVPVQDVRDEFAHGLATLASQMQAWHTAPDHDDVSRLLAALAASEVLYVTDAMGVQVTQLYDPETCSTPPKLDGTIREEDGAWLLRCGAGVAMARQIVAAAEADQPAQEQ